jgi:putative endonuclease
MSTHNKSLGAQGEALAVTFLCGLRYQLIERNFRCKGGEVDIIAKDGRTLVFIEVKTRNSEGYGPPQLAVTPFKQRQISKAALTWLARTRQEDVSARFDVIAIMLSSSDAPRIEHITNAFDLAY